MKQVIIIQDGEKELKLNNFVLKGEIKFDAMSYLSGAINEINNLEFKYKITKNSMDIKRKYLSEETDKKLSVIEEIDQLLPQLQAQLELAKKDGEKKEVEGRIAALKEKHVKANNYLREPKVLEELSNWHNAMLNSPRPDIKQFTDEKRSAEELKHTAVKFCLMSLLDLDESDARRINDNLSLRQQTQIINAVLAEEENNLPYEMLFLRG